MVQLCMTDRVLNLAMMNFPPCWVWGVCVGCVAGTLQESN